MKIVCFAIIVDDCNLSAPDLKKALSSRLRPSLPAGSRGIEVTEAYYPKQRIIKTSSVVYLEDVMDALYSLIVKEVEGER